MSDYKRDQYLLSYFKVKNLLRKYWCENNGWEMSEYIHENVLLALKAVVHFVWIVYQCRQSKIHQ